MTPLEELANKLRTFWLRDIGASSASVSGTASDGSVALARTLFVPAAGGLVGINQVPTDPYALDVSGHARFAGHVYARAGNQWNIGADGAPWGAIYASELHVGNLIAENKIATTGGRILVSPSTKVILAMTTGATTIDVAANTLTSGDRIYLESTGKLEWMAVTSGATAITGGYRYSVTRNLNGAGAQTWSAGDAVVNTGQSGQGFIDLYSRYGIPANGQTSTTRQGPTIVGNVRTSSTYDAIRERWAVGNLKGLYDYAATAYGLAAGDPTAAWISVDATNGIRLVNNATVLGQWTAAGAITIGEVAAGKSNVAISSGQLDVRSNATNRISLTSAGILTIRNSSGNAVFTFDSSAGAEFTLPLTLATTGGIYQGTGTFASPTTGLKIYNSGGIGLIAGYNTGTAQWYADTDGKLYAGGGSVKLDAAGLTLTEGTSITSPSSIKWGTAGYNLVAYYAGGYRNGFFRGDFTGTTDNAYLYLDSFAGTGGVGVVKLRTQSNNGVTFGDFAVNGNGDHVLNFTLSFNGTTSGSAKIKAAAVAGTPTLTLPTSSGTFALTSQLTASSLSGAFNLSGTTNQITVTGSAAVLLNNAITLSLPQNIHTAATPQFAGVKTAYVYPSANGTTAFQVRKADGTTNIVNVDSTNSRVGVLTSGPLSTVDVVGDFRLVDVSGATLTGAAQTNRLLSIDNTNTDYINLAHYSVNRTRSRGTITVSNSAAAWQNNFVQLMVHGSTHPVLNYCTGTGFSTDAGSAILLAQGSEIQALQIGVYDSKPVHLFTANTLRMSIHQSGAISGTMDTMTYASTISLDVTKANLHKTTTVNATGNATINASAVGTAGQHMWILIVNDATSGKVITFGTNFKSTGTLTGTASKQATIHFISDGVSWSEVARTLNL